MKSFAVVDISSSSVAAAHVVPASRDGSTKTTFLASARSELSLQDDLNIERFVEETVVRLGEVVSAIHTGATRHPQYIQVVLASPWYSSQTRTITYKKNTPFTCTQKLIDSLVDKEVEHVLKNEEGSFGSFGNESLIVEKQLSVVKLNGYATTDPFGKQAEHLEIALTLTIAPKAVLDRFTDVLRRAYGTRKIGYTTGAFTAYVVARDTLPVQDECVIVDVGEEVTDVAFVKGGFMRYQHSFPCGTYALYRALATHGNRTPSETKAMLEAYRLHTLGATQSKAVEKGLDTFTRQWQSGLREVIDSGQYGFQLPAQWIISANPRFQSLIVTAIAEDEFIRHTTARDTTTLFLNPAISGSSIAFVGEVKADIPLCIAALFVERLLY